MEILGLFVVILLGSILESGLAFLRNARAKPQAKVDAFIDARYGRMASEFSLGSIQTA